MAKKRLSLMQEFKRRKVGRAVMAWGGTAVIVKEGVEIFGPVVGLGDAGVRIVFFLVLLSFPAFLFFAWTFEITDEGIEETDEVDEEATPAEKAERLAEAKRGPSGLAIAGLFIFLASATFYVLDPGGTISNLRGTLATRFWNGINATEVTAGMIEGGFMVDETLSVGFTGEVDPSSASSENVRLLDSEGELVPAVVSLESSGDVIRIDPANRLRFGATYTVEITDDLRAADGREVWNPERTGPGSTFTFETQPVSAGSPRPRAALADGFNANRAPVNGPVPLAFDTEIDPTSMEGAIRMVGADGAEIPVRFLTAADNREIRVEPENALQRGGRYAILVDSTLLAANGMTAVADSFGFRVTPPAAARPTPVQSTPTPAPPPAADPTGPGRLTLTIVPANAAEFVKVVIDGDTVPQPVTGLQLAEGRSHLIRVVGVPELSAYTIPVFERSLPVTPGQVLNLTAEITPFGSVDIASQPTGIVFIDGREVGRTPLAGYPVTAGVIHELEIRPLPEDADAYAPFTGDIRVDMLEWRSLGRLQLPSREPMPRR